MSESIFDRRLLPHHHTPTEHNEGEYFGVEYLYRQAGREFVLSQDSTLNDDSELLDNMDEGFIDDSMAAPSMSEHEMTVGVEAPGEEQQQQEEGSDHEDDHEDDNEVLAHTQMTIT